MLNTHGSVHLEVTGVGRINDKTGLQHKTSMTTDWTVSVEYRFANSDKKDMVSCSSNSVEVHNIKIFSYSLQTLMQTFCFSYIFRY